MTFEGAKEKNQLVTIIGPQKKLIVAENEVKALG
jgi:hypothetical protein